MAQPRLGLLAQPHRTGLGIQQMEFARAMKPSKVLVTDLTKAHAANSRNDKQVSVTNWFDSYERLTIDLEAGEVPNEDSCRWLLEDIDVLFVIETPINWEIFKWAGEMGVKTVLQYNYEFLEYAQRSVPKPDLFLAPSPWMMGEVRKYGEVKYLPVPVATDRIKRRQITKGDHFIHITGHKAFADRNGTEIVKEARRHLKQCNLTIHDQSTRELPNYWDLYSEGDVLVLPRRYGGLSLQVQEAAASGMPVIITEQDPYGGEACAIPVHASGHMKLKLKAEVDCWSMQPLELAKKINELMQMESIEELSEKAYHWADSRSWERLKPAYQKMLGDLCV